MKLKHLWSTKKLRKIHHGASKEACLKPCPVMTTIKVGISSNRRYVLSHECLVLNVITHENISARLHQGRSLEEEVKKLHTGRISMFCSDMFCTGWTVRATFQPAEADAAATLNSILDSAKFHSTLLTCTDLVLMYCTH